MSTRVVSATEFKSKYRTLLDEMEQCGEPITITRRGRPVAVLSPPKKTAWKSSKGSWAGRAKIVGDIVNLDTSVLWDIVENK